MFLLVSSYWCKFGDGRTVNQLLVTGNTVSLRVSLQKFRCLFSMEFVPKIVFIG